MRYRTTILFLLACVLAANPAMDANRQQARCLDANVSSDSGNLLTLASGDSSHCTFTTTKMGRLLQVMAGICALGACVSAVKAWRDRQQDRALLRGAQLPEWGRGEPYR